MSSAGKGNPFFRITAYCRPDFGDKRQGPLQIRRFCLYPCTRKRRPAGVAGHPRPAPMNMNREILRIALPNIVSNITVPLMGIVSTAIAGHWGVDLGGDDRRTGHRGVDLQLHLLELLVRAHGNQRTHGTGVRRREFPRMHQHARRGDGRGGGHGIADARPAIPAGRAGPVGTERQRNDARTFLRPHPGGDRLASSCLGSTAGSRVCRMP